MPILNLLKSTDPIAQCTYQFILYYNLHCIVTIQHDAWQKSTLSLYHESKLTNWSLLSLYQRGILTNWSVLSPYQRSELTNVPVLLRIGGGRWGGQEDLPDRRKGGRRGLTPGGRGPTPGRRLTNWWWWWGRRDRPTGWGEKGGTLLKIKNKKINTAERKSYRFTFRIEKNMENGNQSNFKKSILVK